MTNTLPVGSTAITDPNNQQRQMAVNADGSINVSGVTITASGINIADPTTPTYKMKINSDGSINISGTVTASSNITQFGGQSVQLDGSNYPIFALGTTLAGEDIANNIMRVEQHGSYAIINSNTTTVVKNINGFLYRIVVCDPGSSWVLTCYDNNSASGTPFTIKPTAVGALAFDITFNTGLTIVTTGTTAGNVVVSYR